MVLVFAALVFVPAGRLDWTFGWIYVGIVALNVIITWVCLLRWNPVLIERRMRFPQGTKTWDKVWAFLYAPVGLAIFVPGSALLTWSMVVNPFFEKTVRIQTEHGHRVIDTGPYAYVRHPGYAGLVGWILSTPLLLGSAWATIPAFLAVLGLLIRTTLEDRTLQAELPGYAEYVARVRFRLLPGVW
jgi:protein-S-isoprenylcysteine O-methyltransferase Ste14